MTNVDAVFGRSEQIRSLVEELSGEGPASVLIRGPSGSGKTYLIENVLNQISDSLDATIVLNGDEAAQDQDLRPFQDFLEDLKHNHLRALVAPGFQAAAKAVPMVGWSLSDFIGLLSEQRQTNKMRWLSKRSETEKELLLNLSARYKKKSLAIFCDDIQYFDTKSIEFIRFLKRAKTQEQFPFLKRVRWIASHNIDAGHNTHKIEKTLFDEILELRYCTSHEFPKILDALGLQRSLDARQYDELYALCGGNLKFAAELVDQLNRSVDPNGQFALHERHASEFLAEILKEKFNKLDQYADILSGVLKPTAVLGTHVDYGNFQCLLGRTASKPADLHDAMAHDLLKHTEEAGLIALRGKRVRFMHELIRSYFVEQARADERQHHSVVARCLRSVQPGNYLVRYLHTRKSGAATEAAELLIAACLAHQRQGLVPESVLGPEAKTFLDELEYADTLDILLQIHQYYHRAVYSECLDLLDALGGAYGRVLRAELAYLRARTHVSILSDKHRREAREICEDWRGHTEEPEQWSRLQSLHVVALVQLADFSGARKIAQDLEAHFGKRKRYDDSAAFELARLDRRHSMLLAPKPAEERVRRAVGFFGPSPNDTDDAPSVPREYYISLCNHASCLISLTRYSEALRAAGAAEALRASHPMFDWPFPEFVLSNLILASVLGAHITPGQASEQYRKILSDFPSSPDIYLLIANTAACEIWASEIGRAHDRLRTAKQELEQHEDYDQYYVYYIEANFAVTLYFNGEPAQALALLDHTRANVEALGDKSRAYMRRRHDILRGALADHSFATPSELDKFFIERKIQEVGDLWPRYSRAVALTTIEHWET